MATRDLMSEVQAAVERKELSATAVEPIRQWLTESRFRAYAAEVERHIRQGLWKELDDAFWTVIPFGTGGRRGRMYPIGCNAINDRTIGESAQGLAEYVRSLHPPGTELSAAIAYDTRHRSRHFAELCAGILVAAGFRVYFLDDYRSTPALSFLVRRRGCQCGIMVTASHNPPSDNAVKVYWSNGGQVLPPHDQAIISRVMQVDEISCVAFAEAVEEGHVVLCTAETDAAYQSELRQQAFPGPRQLKVIYSPLHGVGAASVIPALAADGFTDVEVFEPHRQPDGDFPQVPGHVANPENPAVFQALIGRGRETGADLALATDPDCDRMGAAAPVTRNLRGPWGTLNGNQLGALLADYVLEQRKRQGTLTPQHFIVTTLVTTPLIRRIAESYGVRTIDRLHVGFKWIVSAIDEHGPEQFVYATEESHGFLVGQYARDKDGAVACMLLAELAAHCKARSQSLHQKLEALYWQHGYHAERLLNVTMPGAQGMDRMRALMARLRQDPPQQIGGIPVRAVRDYLSQTSTPLGGSPEPLDGPRGDMVVLDLAAPGNLVAVRPSGTEPKAKFYMFGFQPAELLADLEETRQQLTAQLRGWEEELKKLG